MGDSGRRSELRSPIPDKCPPPSSNEASGLIYLAPRKTVLTSKGTRSNNWSHVILPESCQQTCCSGNKNPGPNLPRTTESILRVSPSGPSSTKQDSFTLIQHLMKVELKVSLSGPSRAYQGLKIDNQPSKTNFNIWLESNPNLQAVQMNTLPNMPLFSFWTVQKTTVELKTTN